MGDYCFVDKDVEILDPAKYARLFPYSGPKWYWREAVQYMLDIGVIQWAYIKHTLTTTAHLNHDLFANMFTTMEETKAHVRTESLNNITPAKFTKECINNLLGLWSKPKLHSCCVDTVSYTEDLKRSGPRSRDQSLGA